MNKKIAGTVIAFLITIIFTSSFGIAFAAITQHDYERAGGNCVIDVAGKPLFRLVAYGQIVGDYYSGRADRLMVQELISGTWTTVVAYEDNAYRSEFSVSLGSANPEYVVKPGWIQILRDEDSKILMVHWNKPLVCPATGGLPAVTIPPGILVITGAGDLKLATTPNYPTPVKFGPNGWYYTIYAHYYSGTASFFCEDWDCKWVSVGAAYTGSQEPRVIVDRVWTWTHA